MALLGLSLGAWYCLARSDAQFFLSHHFLNHGSTFQGENGRWCLCLPLCLVQLAEVAGLPTCRGFSWEVSGGGGRPWGEEWLSVKVCFDASCVSEVMFSLPLWVVLRRLAEEDAPLDRCTSRGPRTPCRQCSDFRSPEHTLRLQVTSLPVVEAILMVGREDVLFPSIWKRAWERVRFLGTVTVHAL